MAKTVADQFAETLAAAGVNRIYGIVGDSLNGLTDALRRQGKIKWVHVRHEEVAAFAAGAEAHLTGELAVCAGSCGPGNLHLINGLFDCHRSRVPVLAIAAQIPSAEISAGYFQETHPQNLFKECSHYCELISGADQMPRALEAAIREALGKRGVSVLVIPGDVALQAAAAAPPPKVAGLLLPRPVVMPEKSDLDRLSALLNGEGKVTILCADGLGRALSGDERQASARRLVLAWLDGQCDGPGNRRAGGVPWPPGDLAVRRRRFHHADGDFLSLVQLGLPVKVVVFNNGALGFIELEQKSTGFLPFGTEFKNPNFAAMAEAVGVRGIRLDDPGEVEAGIAAALTHDGPVLVDAVVNRTELVMPPAITLEMARGFTLYMVRAVMSGRGEELIDLARTNLWR